MNQESWLTAEVPGPKKASLITKPEIADAMIRRASRPVFVVGSIASEIDLEEKKLIDYVIRLARQFQIRVIATGSTNTAFLARDFTPDAVMPAVDAGFRLADPAWQGVDGNGPHDLAIFVGLPYQMGFTILSGLKHFAPSLKTISLDNVYQPNARWSFSNISIKNWIINLEAIIGNKEEE
ncbi:MULTISPECIES: CO dehydrogenase/acetyl-CoA synthase complex subunit epsilon [Methanocalculus]|uniref:CO dehydrogenase/acetyl-CoA synthase complex subunit epsilon n=1 Tax=Methanocalculus TaxID=71151 RepID=UPI00209FAACD|nr:MULTISPECIES: CO dehydrogenase/acetyl-CoA synthase complex subunit epsilon [unclassified Methanocalculus]MCP1662555.1 acetyl-CoA decarbonylase/synthase complex subunit epsilon [Methanocalculus sp. AMF5]